MVGMIGIKGIETWKIADERGEDNALRVEDNNMAGTVKTLV